MSLRRGSRRVKCCQTYRHAMQGVALFRQHELHTGQQHYMNVRTYNYTMTPMWSFSNWSSVTINVANTMVTFALSVKILASTCVAPFTTRVILMPGGLLHGRTVTLYETTARTVLLVHRMVSQSFSPFVVQLAESTESAMSRSTSQVLSSSSLLSQLTAKRCRG